jgi:hypothetical protein
MATFAKSWRRLTLRVEQAKIDGLCAAIARGGAVVCEQLTRNQCLHARSFDLVDMHENVRPPPSGTIKPYPRSSLKNLTRPVGTSSVPLPHTTRLQPLAHTMRGNAIRLHSDPLAKAEDATHLGWKSCGSTASNLGWRRAPQVKPPSNAVFIFGSVEDIT